jgi:hypothetical protein
MRVPRANYTKGRQVFRCDKDVIEELVGEEPIGGLQYPNELYRTEGISIIIGLQSFQG